MKNRCTKEKEKENGMQKKNNSDVKKRQETGEKVRARRHKLQKGRKMR